MLQKACYLGVITPGFIDISLSLHSAADHSPTSRNNWTSEHTQAIQLHTCTPSLWNPAEETFDPNRIFPSILFTYMKCNRNKIIIDTQEKFM